MYNLLYKSGSSREVGTLNFFREKYNQGNVTPEKVTDSYEGTEQFLLQIGKAYITEAALEFWGMEKLDDCLAKNKPLPGIAHQKNENKVEYFNTFIGKFVDVYILPGGEKEKVATHDYIVKKMPLINIVINEVGFMWACLT